MFCRSSGGAGAVALMSNLSGCSPACALPVILTLRSAPIDGVGVDAVDAVFDAVAQVGKCHRAVGHRDALDGGRVDRVCSKERLAWQDAGLARRLRSRSSGTCSTGRVITSSVTSGWPDHRLAKRHVGLDAADGQAIAGVAVLRRLQRDVVHRHVQRRPQADPGRARDRQPVAGFALDPRPGSPRSGSPRGFR